MCDGWTVKDLADHVLGGNRFAVALLAGRSAQDAYAAALEARFDGDPFEEFQESAAAQTAAFASFGDLRRLVPHLAGDIPAQTFLGFRVGDLLLHGWDLARSIGTDDSLDSELVVEVWNSPQAFGGAIAIPALGTVPGDPLPEDTPLADRLLGATGRAVRR
jgi:uncharacterized protein (TIGR03086 family)